MSAVEATKPVEEPVVAPTETATEAPAVSETKPVETAAETTTTETPAATVPETTEAAPAVEEAKPVEEGVLGTKGPGFIKNLFFDKKFFWFGTEPVESKALTSYLRGEKNQEAAQKNIAWATSTGKGLLYFNKGKVADKKTPAGVINLSEVSDIVEEGTDKFAFTYEGHKHTFEASTLAERDSWVAVLKTKTAEAKELATTVPETEEYKKSLAEFAPKTPVVAAAVPKEEKKEEKAEAKEEKKEEKKEAKEEKKEEKKEIKEEKKDTRKSRSASRKRTSIFGAIPGFGKKEEKTEAPKEDAVAAPATEETTAAPVEPVTAPETTAATEETAPVTEATPTTPTEKPAPVKRNSIFGTLKFGKKDKSDAEAAPAVPAKDAAEPVSETAPVIPAVEASEPLGTDVSSPATVPTETTEAAPITNGETKAETPTTKNDKRKSSLPFFNKKDKVPATEEGEKTEKPKSPGFSFSKVRDTIKGKSSPKALKATEKPAEGETSTETPAATEEATPAAAPVANEPEPVVSQTTPQVTASA